MHCCRTLARGVVTVVLVACISGLKTAAHFGRFFPEHIYFTGELGQQSQTSLLFIGDYGFAGTPAQLAVASQLERSVAKDQPPFIVSVGDNFYGPDGVAGVDDQNWQTHWYKVYKRDHPEVRPLPWHAVLGNHDYCRSAEAQIDYQQNGWRMDDFFWVHSQEIGGQTLSILYIDTNLLAYGLDTEPWLRQDCPNMRTQFKRWASDPDRHWAQDEQLRLIEQLLSGIQGSHWIFVVGHHPVGGAYCGGEGRLEELMPIFESHRVSAYFCGHVHALEYGQRNGVAYITSGAGGDDTGVGCTENGPGTTGKWARDRVAGFVSARLVGDELRVSFIDSQGQRLHRGISQRQ